MRRIGPALAAAALAFTGFAVPVVVSETAAAAPVIAMHHACTRTSTGHCIRGGEFCPHASAGKYGWDGKGRKYICRDGHWEIP